MSVSTNSSDKPRIPLEVEGIQVNFCKNPCCGNFADILTFEGDGIKHGACPASHALHSSEE